VTSTASLRSRLGAAALGTFASLAVVRPVAAQDTTQAAPAARDTAFRRVPVLRTPPPVPPPWVFGIEGGFTDIGGNTSLQVFNGAFTVVHKLTTLYVLNMRVEARYGRSDSVVAASNAAAHLRFNWRPRAGVSPFASVDLESDEIQKIDSRLTGASGLNFNVAPREDRHTTISIGLAADLASYFAHVVPNSMTDIRYQVSFATLQPLSAGAAFEGNAQIQPTTTQLDDYLATMDLAMRITITRTLAFRTRYDWKRDSTPAEGVLSKDDRSFTVSLLMNW